MHEKHDNMNDKVVEWLTLLSCVSGESNQTWSKYLVWSAPSAMCQNTSESSAEVLSLDTGYQEHNMVVSKINSLFLNWPKIILQLGWWLKLSKKCMHAYSPLTGTPRKSLLEMSTTVQRSKLRTSTWSKLSKPSKWVCVEETQTSTVCCKLGPVRADTEDEGFSD